MAETSDGNPALDGPAYLSNRVWVYRWDGVVRIAFCEQDGPDYPATFRTAAAMTVETAKDLLGTLAQMLGET